MSDINSFASFVPYSFPPPPTANRLTFEQLVLFVGAHISNYPGRWRYKNLSHRRDFMSIHVLLKWFSIFITEHFGFFYFWKIKDETQKSSRLDYVKCFIRDKQNRTFVAKGKIKNIYGLFVYLSVYWILSGSFAS